MRMFIIIRQAALSCLLNLFFLGSLNSVYGQAKETCPSWGPYVTGNGLGNKPGLLLMSEVMVTSACLVKNTYWSTMNFQLGPRGGYAGIQRKSGNSPIHNNIFSIWDLKDSKSPQCFTEFTAPNVFVDGFGGEGTGLHTDTPIGWKPGVWYTSVVRRWYTASGQTRIGFFMYDYSTTKWTHYVTAVTPEDNVFFKNSDISGFLEKFGSEPGERCGFWRSFWKLNADKTWNTATSISAGAGTGAWRAQKTSASEVKMYSCGTYTAPQSSYSFPITTAEVRPSVATPAVITNSQASFSNNQVTVKWAMDESKSPQLSYTINVYDNKDFAGNPIATATEIRPQARSRSLSLAGGINKTYYISLQVTDIFEQTSNVLNWKLSSATNCDCGTR